MVRHSGESGNPETRKPLVAAPGSPPSRQPYATLDPADRFAVGPGGFDRKAIERVEPPMGEREG